MSASPPIPPGAVELRILVADDDPLVRSALRALLADQPDLRLVGEAADGLQAVELAIERRPDVVVLDEGIVGLDAVTVIERIRAAAPEVRVVVFSAVEDPDRGVAGLRSGATGYLLKEMSGEALLRALRGIAHGEAALSRALTLRIVEQLYRETQEEPDPRRAWNRLTAGEWQVLQLLTAGGSVAEVADAIALPPAEVCDRIAQILVKLEVPTLDDAVAAAERMLAEEPAPDASTSLDEVTRRRMERHHPPRD